jgi:hypothetical protein
MQFVPIEQQGFLIAISKKPNNSQGLKWLEMA